MSRLLLGLSVAAALLASEVHAQEWPTRPVKFIVSQAAGMFTGTPQSTAAYIAAQLEVWRKIVNEIGLQPE